MQIEHTVNREAHQFTGGWESAEKLFSWAECVFYVPDGVALDHHLREDCVISSVSGERCYTDTGEFLIVSLPARVARMNPGDWLVEDANGYLLYTDKDFNDTFKLVRKD